MAAIVICFGLLAAALGRWSMRKKESHITEPYTDENMYEEYKLHLVLEKLPGHKRILRNIHLPLRGGKTIQIDLLMISEKGIHIVNLKYFGGWIFGSEAQAHWTQTFGPGPGNKFPNPIRENARRIRILENLLRLRNSEYFESLIVFNERAVLKKIIIYSDRVIVLKRNKLSVVLKENLLASSAVITPDEIDRFYTILEPFAYSHKNSEEKQEQNKDEDKSSEDNLIVLRKHKKR